MYDTMRAHTKATRQEVEDRAGELLDWSGWSPG